MQNVEFKAELRDIALARTLLPTLGATFVEVLKQTDTYCRIADAKLKKRETVGYPTEWVFYSRASRTRPKLSTFTIYSDEAARERFGSAPLPVWLVVRKSRELWTWQGIRIHLDSVEGLGNFVEFEALVCPERNLARAHEGVDRLRAGLGPALGEAIAVGYADLLAKDVESASPVLPPSSPGPGTDKAH